MAAAIPFINGESDAKVASEAFPDSTLFKVSLWNADSVVQHLPAGARIWMDLAFDGYPEFDPASKWALYMSALTGHRHLADPAFVSNPTAKITDEFVHEVLSRALQFDLAAISVPQLCHQDDVVHNAVNRQLAASFAKFASNNSLPPLRILPAVFTNQNQITLKTARNKKLAAVKACFQKSGANAVWAVDSSLADQSGTSTFENRRFPGVLDLHRELAEIGELKLHVAGPYWGLNLVLWARGFVTNPATALGTGFQYYRAGQRATSPTPRVALGPLRRWSKATSDFWSWLDVVIQRLDQTDPARREFEELRRLRPSIELTGAAKRQVALFYSNWVQLIEQQNPASRALVLFQDLSAAHVLGSALPDIPSETGRAKQANVVARQLMLNCL